MNYAIQHDNPIEIQSDCLVVAIFEGQVLSPTARAVDEASDGAISRLLESGDLDGKKGQILLQHYVPGVASQRVMLVGCGDQKKFDGEAFHMTATRIALQLNKTAAASAALALTELEVDGHDGNWKLRHLTEALEAGHYRFHIMKSEPPKTRLHLTDIVYAIGKDLDTTTAERAVAQGKAIAAGAKLAKDLGNLPGNVCTPTYLADEAVKLAKEFGMKSTILEEKDMEELGMGALLSVSRGSRQPAKLIVVEYQGGNKGDAPYVLVGKGLTFDAGGISIKPSANMDEMKYDMCGGASVVGTLRALGELELPINVVGVIPSSENLPDGDANKPGDIVTSMSGQTIEILNTDAEGRLILCDALTYSERFEPAAVVDIATLTGACVVALGEHASGLLGNDDDLAKELLSAGEYAADRAWQLPLWDPYQKQLDSNFADMANIGGRAGGTITAACFLSRYTKAYKWAHLDIAGTAWKSGKAKGSTGRPVGLLTQYLIDRAGQST
jgi:leucyl aminopeptidase